MSKRYQAQVYQFQLMNAKSVCSGLISADLSCGAKRKKGFKGTKGFGELVRF